jgi:6,7-dimethyl-8-ribityllumazine synthase
VTRIDVESGRVPERIGIAVSAFNEPITEPMLDAALAEAERAGVAEVVVLRVPGAMELPLAAQSLAEEGCEAIVAIGAVIKGETDHYEYVAEHATRGITDVSTRTGVPVGNALLTVREYEHAVERSLPGPGNKGAEATEAAITLARKLTSLRKMTDDS